MKIVPDTNVLISGIVYLNSIPGKIVSAWKQKSLSFVLSHFILDEFSRVLPKMNKNTLSGEEIRELTELVIFLSEIVDHGQERKLTVRDVNDRLVLGTLVASGADYLVTGDNDLLVLAEHFPIITPRAFWERHG